MAPAPRLVLRLDSPAGWITPPAAGHPAAMIPADTAARLKRMLPKVPVTGDASAVEWYGCGGSAETNPDVSWYAGLQTGVEDPIVVVAVMEGQPSTTVDIGRKVLMEALAAG